MKRLPQMFFFIIVMINCNCSGNKKPPPPEDILEQVPDTIKEEVIVKEYIPTNIFDFEVYFFDVTALKDISPPYRGRPTYTGEVYVANFNLNTLDGPFVSSTFPNSRANDLTSTVYNTVLDGSYIFNNKSGHKSATRRGLNLVLDTGLRGWEGRFNLGFDMNSDTVLMENVNVHGGTSNLGNYNSRGSHGCLTILPKDTIPFFKQFGMEHQTTGNLEGGLYVFRNEDESIKTQVLEQIKSEMK